MSGDEARDELEEAAAFLAGHAITRVEYLGAWQEAPEEPGGYVEFVQLTMDDGAVPLFPVHDNVAVVFGDGEAARLGVGRWRRREPTAP